MTAYIGPRVEVLRGWLRGRSDLVLKSAVLRQQLAMYKHRRHPHIRDADRLFGVVLARLWPRWREALVAVRPETVVRRHRAGRRRYWSWKSRPRRRGRSRIDPEARELIVSLAGENRTWGAVRIQGELRAWFVRCLRAGPRTGLPGARELRDTGMARRSRVGNVPRRPA